MINLFIFIEYNMMLLIFVNKILKKKIVWKNKFINCYVILWGLILIILFEYNLRSIEKFFKNYSGYLLINVFYLLIRFVKIDDLFMRYWVECFVILRI